MTRKTFLTITSLVALTIGAVVLTMPGSFIASVKGTDGAGAASVMARTVGILLVAIGLLDFLVRGHGDGPTMRAILATNLFLQLGILPIDPLAYATGTYPTLVSFVPNTALHVLLAGGFAHFLAESRRRPHAVAGPTAEGDGRA
jgi:hypothetical protein